MNRTPILLSGSVTIVAFLVGVMLGVMVADRLRTKAFREAREAQEARRSALRAEYESQVAAAQGQLDDVNRRIWEMESAWARDARWEERTYDLPLKYLKELVVDVVDWETRRFTMKGAELLRLKEEEFHRLGAAVQRAWSRVARAESAHVSLQVVDGNTVLLAVSPFPDEGRRIREQLVEELEKIIGSSRTRALFAMGGYSMSVDGMWFMRFGVEPYRYTFRQRTPGDWNLNVDAFGSGHGYAGVPSHEAGRFFEVLPPYLQKYVKPEDRGLPDEDREIGPSWNKRADEQF